MYSDKLLKVANENGYAFKTSLKNLDGYCKITELVNGDHHVLVRRYSSEEDFRREDEDIINDILHPVNYEDEFNKIFGIA